jgi:hypothetical protein
LYFPAAVIRPAKRTIYPDADFVVAIAGVAKIFQPDVWIIEVMNQTELIESDE